ncbi:phosphotransferase enzyme family protein [soil metagenome]
MKLSRMWSVDGSVDDVTHRGAIADLIAARWGENLAPRRFRASANFTYVCDIGEQRAFLRFAHESDRTRDDIEREMELLIWLAAQQIAANEPIRSSSNALVESVETETGAFHAVMLTRVIGKNHEFEQLDGGTAQRWGAAIGSLHATLANAPENLRRGPGFWQKSLDHASLEESGFPAIVQREAIRLSEALAELPQTPENYGLIHCDLELDNVFDQESRFALIDFDEYCSGWFAFDLAKAFSEGLSETEVATTPLIDDFIAGYRSEHALSEQMLQAIPIMLRLSNLNSSVRVRRSLDLAPDFQRVGWMANLERNLSVWAAEYEASLSQFD